jgi:uncharacterized protein
MRIIRFSELRETPWKNGGGVTREIAIARDRDAWDWRLSMADVGVDGPFSKFDGMQRILTVVEGRGMELICPHIKLQADLGVPVRFDGAWEIVAKLTQGPLRGVNVIYDAGSCEADARVVGGEFEVESNFARLYAIHCISGSITLNETDQLHRGDTALIEQGGAQFVTVGTASALLISFTLLRPAG